jgi:hypothetical protein
VEDCQYILGSTSVTLLNKIIADWTRARVRAAH